MKKRKVLAVMLAAVMALGVTACGSSSGKKGGSDKGSDSKELSYANIELGKDYTDLKANITMFNHRTDMDSDDYGGKNWKAYLEDFNKMYPGIKVDITTDTNYADDALTHLQSGDYETIMMIPAVDKADLSNYFISYGDIDTMQKEINYANSWMYDGEVYGVPSTATTQGIVYNKKVFEKAGIKEVPKTPEEFINALKAIKEKTKAIPLYTNYAAGWTMGAWDAYIGINATGDTKYMNQKLLHAKDPFQDYGDGAHAYNVYKILYDAVSNKLIEDDYTTSDWESSKTKLNNGEIGCMVLGSWSYPQMEAAGKNGDDIGYMPFPITVEGKQYAVCGADYSYGINVNASEEEKEAAMVFVKWMTEKSGFSYNEDGLPIDASSTDTKLDFSGVDLLQDDPAVEGEEDLLNSLNSDSELNINAGGNDKIQAIIEHAANGDKSFDDIMKEWNEAWTSAQEAEGVEVK